MKKPIVFTLVCLLALAMVGFAFQQTSLSFGGPAAKASEVRGADITEPDFTTSTTVGFCSDLVKHNWINQSLETIRLQRIGIVQGTVYRAEAWMKLKGIKARLEIIENTSTFTKDCSHYDCKVIVFLDPVTTST